MCISSRWDELCWAEGKRKGGWHAQHQGGKTKLLRAYWHTAGEVSALSPAVLQVPTGAREIEHAHLKWVATGGSAWGRQVYGMRLSVPWHYFFLTSCLALGKLLTLSVPSVSLSVKWGQTAPNLRIVGRHQWDNAKGLDTAWYTENALPSRIRMILVCRSDFGTSITPEYLILLLPSHASPSCSLLSSSH